MSARGAIDLKRDIVSARIEGCFVVLRKKGMDKGKLEVAGNMYQKGFAFEDICDVTGLSEKDILNGWSLGYLSFLSLSDKKNK